MVIGGQSGYGTQSDAVASQRFPDRFLMWQAARRGRLELDWYFDGGTCEHEALVDWSCAVTVLCLMGVSMSSL